LGTNNYAFKAFPSFIDKRVSIFSRSVFSWKAATPDQIVPHAGRGLRCVRKDQDRLPSKDWNRTTAPDPRCATCIGIRPRWQNVGSGTMLKTLAEAKAAGA